MVQSLKILVYYDAKFTDLAKQCLARQQHTKFLLYSEHNLFFALLQRKKRKHVWDHSSLPSGVHWQSAFTDLPKGAGTQTNAMIMYQIIIKRFILIRYKLLWKMQIAAIPPVLMLLEPWKWVKVTRSIQRGEANEDVIIQSLKGLL